VTCNSLCLEGFLIKLSNKVRRVLSKDIKKGNLYDDEMGAVPKERLVKKIEEMV
jgi:hypothetical protein